MSLEIFNSDHTPSILKKPIEAIQVAILGGYQTRTQRLAFNLFLQHAHHVGMDIHQYKMPKQELLQLLDYNSRNLAHLKKTLTAMQTMRVEWDVLAVTEGRKKQDGRWNSLVMIQYVGFDRDNVYFEFDQRVKSYLFDPETYANLDLNIQKRLTLDVAFVLYEWAVRYRNVRRTRAMHWEQWRNVLFADPDHSVSMLEYKEFKRRKLLPAIRELNELTDLQVELVESKGGTRAVSDVQFVIKEKPRFAMIEEGDLVRREIDARLTEWGMSKTERRNIFQRYSMKDIETTTEYVANRLSANGKGGQIKDAARYFKVCISRGYALTALAQEPAAVESAVPAPQENPAEVIQQRFHEWRNSQAAQMFGEMEEALRLSHVETYNASCGMAFHVPLDPKGRSNRVMIPFFAWLAHRTWGEPAVNDVLEFALKTTTATATSKPTMRR